MRGRGFTVVELLVVVTITLVLAAIAVPRLLEARDQARRETCRNIFVALDPSFWNGGFTEWRSNGCGTAVEPGPMVDCTLSLHTDEDNPYDRHQRAYTVDEPEPCQVQLVPEDAHIVVRQRMPDDVVRTFRIDVVGPGGVGSAIGACRELDSRRAPRLAVGRARPRSEPCLGVGPRRNRAFCGRGAGTDARDESQSEPGGPFPDRLLLRTMGRPGLALVRTSGRY